METKLRIVQRWGSISVRPERTMLSPIPGTSKILHLEENIAAADGTLSEADFAALPDRDAALVARDRRP